MKHEAWGGAGGASTVGDMHSLRGGLQAHFRVHFEAAGGSLRRVCALHGQQRLPLLPLLALPRDRWQGRAALDRLPHPRFLCNRWATTPHPSSTATHGLTHAHFSLMSPAPPLLGSPGSLKGFFSGITFGLPIPEVPSDPTSTAQQLTAGCLPVAGDVPSDGELVRVRHVDVPVCATSQR